MEAEPPFARVSRPSGPEIPRKSQESLQDGDRRLRISLRMTEKGVNPYNGSEVPQGENRQTINLAQKWVKNGGFSSLAGSGPKVGPKWVSAFFFTKSAPKPTLDPPLGHFQPMTKNPIFDPSLCQINCLAILALRDLRSIIRVEFKGG